MAFKNLCKGRELAGDLLRQRRDFYAISLGLILFHLAGGVMKDTATLSTLPVKLAHPEVLYWSAWVSFVYFAWRYWVLDPGSVRLFREEWDRQQRASPAFLKICRVWVKKSQGSASDIDQVVSLLTHCRPEIPRAAREGTQVDLRALKNLTSDSATFASGTLRATLDADDVKALRRLKIKGFFRAVFLERTATDLLLPYGMGAAAILISLLTALSGHSL